MTKHLIILQHNPSKGGKTELANQLWNFMSVYAYAQEREYSIENYSFFEYSHYFNIPMKNHLVRSLFFSPFPLLEKKLGHTRATVFMRKIYKLYAIATRVLHRDAILNSYDSSAIPGTFYLPPSKPVRSELAKLEDNPGIKTLYFQGWLFRNPVGILKYHREITDYFRPQDWTVRAVATFMGPLRKQYTHVVAVHIRQGDYKIYKGGRYYTEQARIREILDEYLREFKKEPLRTCFVLTSNGPIEKRIFAGLNIIVSGLGFIEDLFLLASCDTVIGSDSSFGNFAAYYGNIPHIVFQNGPMDWEYYRDKTDYFWNKYCTLVHF